MKFINNDFVSRKYYEGACAYYQKSITRLTEENKLYETKLRKITKCMELLITALNGLNDIYGAIAKNDLNDIYGAISKITDVDCNLRMLAYKLGRILDDHEMF